MPAATVPPTSLFSQRRLSANFRVSSEAFAQNCRRITPNATAMTTSETMNTGLMIAYNGQARADLMSQDYSVADKTMQLAGRLASIPAAISGLPAAITSLNYLKQIIVTKGISMRFDKLVEEIRPGLK